MCVHMPQYTYGGQRSLAGVTSLLPACGLQGSNSGLQAWWQAPYPLSQLTIFFPWVYEMFSLMWDNTDLHSGMNKLSWGSSLVLGLTANSQHILSGEVVPTCNLSSVWETEAGGPGGEDHFQLSRVGGQLGTCETVSKQMNKQTEWDSLTKGHPGNLRVFAVQSSRFQVCYPEHHRSFLFNKMCYCSSLS